MKQEENIIDRNKEVTLVEILDRVLNKGVVISGDIVISVADIDLVYLGVRLLLSSVETMEQIRLKKIKDRNAGNEF
ncbi:MAG: gas vesicle protein [Ignavibacteriaceae bacterium]